MTIDEDVVDEDDVPFPLKTPTGKQKRLPKEWGGTIPDRWGVQSGFFLNSQFIIKE